MKYSITLSFFFETGGHRKIHNNSENVALICKIKPRFSMSEANKVLFISTNKNLVHDDFSHEMVLILRNEKRLIVFSGCLHNGLLNILGTYLLLAVLVAHI